MSLSSKLAANFKAVYYGGNWTAVNLKDSLNDVSWEQAVSKMDHINTIAALVFHIDYFVAAAVRVLQGKALDAHDKYSFDVPPIKNNEDWENLKQQLWQHANALVAALEKLPEEQLWQTFVDEKYGSYYSNLQGTLEHTHYHLGQIVIIKKMLNAGPGMS